MVQVASRPTVEPSPYGVERRGHVFEIGPYKIGITGMPRSELVCVSISGPTPRMVIGVDTACVSLDVYPRNEKTGASAARMLDLKSEYASLLATARSDAPKSFPFLDVASVIGHAGAFDASTFMANVPEGCREIVENGFAVLTEELPRILKELSRHTQARTPTPDKAARSPGRRAKGPSAAAV